MYYKFTARAEKALEIAQELAMELGHNYIGTEHILYGLAKENNGVAKKVLKRQQKSKLQYPVYFCSDKHTKYCFHLRNLLPNPELSSQILHELKCPFRLPYIIQSFSYDR